MAKLVNTVSSQMCTEQYMNMKINKVVVMYRHRRNSPSSYTSTCVRSQGYPLGRPVHWDVGTRYKGVGETGSRVDYEGVVLRLRPLCGVVCRFGSFVPMKRRYTWDLDIVLVIQVISQVVRNSSICHITRGRIIWVHVSSMCHVRVIHSSSQNCIQPNIDSPRMLRHIKVSSLRTQKRAIRSCHGNRLSSFFFFTSF